MDNLPLDEITKRIVDAVLDERFINRDSLNKLIRPILKIWLKSTDGFRTPKVTKDKLQWTIEQRDVERKYWLNKLREVIGEEKMQPYYDGLVEERIREGYHHYEERREN